MKKGISNDFDVQVILGQNIKKARELLKISRKDFCEIVNTSENRPMRKGEIDALDENRLKQWEYGNNPVDINWIPILCKALSVDVGYLFGDYKEHTREFSDTVAVTGLSSEAITTLQIYAKSGIPDYFDRFIRFCGYHAEEMKSNISKAVSSQEEAIGNPAFNEQAYHNYAKISKKRGIKPSSSQPEVINLPDGSVAMSASHAAQFYIDCATRHFREFLTEYVNTTAEGKIKRGVNNGKH